MVKRYWEWIHVTHKQDCGGTRLWWMCLDVARSGVFPPSCVMSLAISIWSKNVFMCLIVWFLWMCMYEFRFNRTPRYHQLEFIRWCKYHSEMQQWAKHLRFSVCVLSKKGRFPWKVKGIILALILHESGVKWKQIHVMKEKSVYQDHDHHHSHWYWHCHCS